MKILLRQTPTASALEYQMRERWFDLDEFTQFEDDGDIAFADDPTYSLEREVAHWVRNSDLAMSYRIVKAEPEIVDEGNLGDSLSDLWEFSGEYDSSGWDDYNVDGLRAYAYDNGSDIDDLLGTLEDLYDRYAGHCDDVAEYAKEWYEGMEGSVPSILEYAIDWESVWDNQLAGDHTSYDHPRNYGVYIFRDYA